MTAGWEAEREKKETCYPVVLVRYFIILNLGLGDCKKK